MKEEERGGQLCGEMEARREGGKYWYKVEGER